jgi:hypothetical protein
MTSRLEQVQQLQQKIKEILLYEWDPIGVGKFSEAHDEYDYYIFPIYELLTSRSFEEIFKYLWWIETEHMGLSGDREKTMDVAKTIFKL